MPLPSGLSIDPFAPFILWRIAGAAFFLLVLTIGFGVGLHYILKLARQDRENRSPDG